MTWPPAGENWEGGYRDKQGRRWVHVPNEGWREANPAPFLKTKGAHNPHQSMSLVEKITKGLWELFHTFDGVQVRWKPFSVRYQQPRWEDR
ncbi:hypothetical protein ABT340_39500 [Streptosporangium sp. NPDC000239]|uniref:hypothetical protein n=1 Tax=Streptosporangium sp. NPDC000239 TaxID=3154248 RepID=UPI00332262CD